MKSKLQSLLTKIVHQDILHAKWINTLSYLENCGAKKIAACQHPTLVKEEMLKHAAEEFRHSHYLKHQIQKVSKGPFDDYSLPLLLGGVCSLNYLNALDIYASRFLIQKVGLSKTEVKKIAYLLVTYAIELRAESLYPIYHEVLRSHKSKVFVKSIILEEEEHLNEMKEGLKTLPSGFIYAQKICAFEEILFKKWIQAIEFDIQNPQDIPNPVQEVCFLKNCPSEYPL